MKSLFAFVVTLFFFVSVAESALAQESVTLSPVFKEIELNENREAEFEVTVRNDATVSLSFRISVLDFGSLDESGGVAFLGANNELEQKYGLASWMRPERDFVTVVPKGEETVLVRIENRDDLSPGGHYGAVVFRSENTEEPRVDNAIGVNQVFSVLVFAKKIGGERYALEYLRDERESSIFSLPQEERLRFRNAGNVHVVPRGEILLTDPLGRLVQKGILNEESGIILPETHRIFPTALRSITHAFIPGFYTQTFLYRHDETDERQVAEGRFFHVPVASIALFAGGGALLWWLYRRKKRGITNSPETKEAV